MPVLVLVTWVTVRPPMTAVSPSSTRSWLSAFCFWKMKPRSAAASGWIADRSVWSCIRHLPVVGDVRGDRETDTGLLELHVGLGLPAGAGRRVDDADRRLLTHEDVGLAVVERRDDRLRLDVGEVGALERAQEARQAEAADGRGEDQVEGRAGDGGVRVADRRQRIAAEVDDVDFRLEGVAGRPDRVALDQLVEELGLAAQVVLEAELLDVGPVHEDDLGLDRELRGAHVEPAHEVGDVLRCGSASR